MPSKPLHVSLVHAPKNNDKFEVFIYLLWFPRLALGMDLSTFTCLDVKMHSNCSETCPKKSNAIILIGTKYQITIKLPYRKYAMTQIWFRGPLNF